LRLRMPARRNQVETQRLDLEFISPGVGLGLR
jgi:hypothetical protein